MSSFWYVGTPYAKYPQGHQAAFEEACRVASTLLKTGMKVFCPIAHAHAIRSTPGSTPLPFTHEFWLGLDKPFVDAAEGLIVVMMEGWEESTGLTWEIEEFTKAGKPILYMPGTDGEQM